MTDSTGVGNSSPLRRGLAVQAGELLAPAVAALAGGLALFWSFAPRDWWWLAPIAFVGIGFAWRGRGARRGAVLGAITGLAFFVPLLSWTGEFVGPVPWLALATLQATFVAAVGAGVGGLPDRWWWPIGGAALWTAGEAARGRVPFDGFPWGRVGFGQPEGAFAPVASLAGVPGLGFVVVLSGFAVLELGRVTVRHAAPMPIALTVALVPAVVAAAAPLATAHVQPVGEIVVAAVQGNVPRSGLDFNAQRRAVLDNHVRRTEELAADVAAGRVERPDLVFWPENSADVDPLRYPDARAAVDRAVRSVGVPVLVGAVLTPPGGPPTNTMIVWDPVAGPGPDHDKRRLQPFGEYVPFKDFFRIFSTLVDRSSDFVPGVGEGVVTAADVLAGVATCYEVIFDDLVRDSIRGGAELLVVPSNNATFGRTAMTYQQLAVGRVRAVETGRATVVPTTSGSSAVVLPDGSVPAQTGLFEPAVLMEPIPLRRDITPGVRIGAAVEWVLVAAAGSAVLAGARVRGRSRTPAGLTASHG